MAANEQANTSYFITSTLTVLTNTTLSENLYTSSPASEMTTVNRVNDFARYVECDWDVPSCKAQQYLFLIMAPILIVMSTVGNSLGLAVMRRKALRNSATAVFISALAVSDTIAVWTGLSRHFIKKLTSYDIRQYSVWTCWFQRFLLYLALDTSAWILAAISIERFLAVCMPLHHKSLKIRSRAWKIVIGILIVQIAFNSQVFFNYGEETVVVNNETQTFACGFRSDEAREYLTVYHPYVSMAVYCLLPASVMLILNIFIIRRLMIMGRAFRRNASTTSRSQINTSSMTKMLLCVTFYFISVTTPAFLFAIFQEQIFMGSELTSELHGTIELIDAISTLLLYLNHSINFLLYCASGKRFKQELSLMLGCFKKSQTVGEVFNTSGTPLMSGRNTATKGASPMAAAKNSSTAGFVEKQCNTKVGKQQFSEICKDAE